MGENRIGMVAKALRARFPGRTVSVQVAQSGFDATVR